MVSRSQSHEFEFISTTSINAENTGGHATAQVFQRYIPSIFRALSSQLSTIPKITKNTRQNLSQSRSQSSSFSRVSSVNENKRLINAGHSIPFLFNDKNIVSINSVHDSSSTDPEILTTSLAPNAFTNPTITSPKSEFPLYVIIICVILVMIMTCGIVYFLCSCLYRRRKRQNQLASITPKSSDPRMAGVRADQPVQFVVPTTIIITETTEDSLSDTDYSSGGPRQLPILMDRRRKRPFSGFHINPSDLQRGLYEGVANMGSNAFFGDLGKVGFTLHYDAVRNHLRVKILGATDLPCLFLKTTGNPCAKVVMMPDRIPKYVTKVQRNTLNPIFNETFIFPVLKTDLNDKKLKISVWDYDKFSRKLLIGQVIYSVKDSEITNALNVESTTADLWIDLKQDVDTHRRGTTELLFSLCYNPETSSLTVCILKIRGLDIGEKEKETSVYVKVTLYIRRKMAKTKKTSSKRKTPNMEFNNSFHIHVPSTSISEVDLLVTVCEKSTGLGNKKIIGRTQVGSNCLADQGLQHWQDMLFSPKSTCAQWHILSTF